MNRDSSGQPVQAAARPDLNGTASRACATPDGAPGWQMTRARATDLDLLRLSYICRVDALLRGTPERSLVLAGIHRFFDRVPSGAALDELLLSALIDRACDRDGSVSAAFAGGPAAGEDSWLPVSAAATPASRREAPRSGVASRDGLPHHTMRGAFCV